MIDSAKATEYLISTMKGWKLGVGDMEGVIDKMAELDRNAAISAGDIAEAMSRANVSAQLAGSELNKYMSYITTVSDVSQLSAETVGTAFKTLYSRYGNVKAGKFVAGAGDEDGEEFEALNDIEKVLNKIGISMRDTSAEFRNFDDVLAEIADKWATLSDVEKNAISTAFAGTRQREVLILRTGI
jgi:TP901 family phage tail tape measure protein